MRRIVALVTVMVVVPMSVVLGGSALLGVGRAADKGVVVVQVGGGVWADASLQPRACASSLFLSCSLTTAGASSTST
jgi:hypothetical protein